MDSIEEIVKLSDTRLKEAIILFKNRCYDGCIYLAGYSIELLFKAKIAEILDTPNLFVEIGKEKIKPFTIHKLSDLAFYAGLSREIAKEDNETFDRYWSLIISQWTENLRYRKCGTCKKKTAENFLKAI